MSPVCFINFLKFETMKKLAMSPIYLTGKSIENEDIKNYLFHVINDGETLSLIAKKFKSSLHDLKKINGLKDEKIYLGQVLKLKNKELIKDFENRNHEKEFKEEKEKILLTDKKFVPINAKYTANNIEFPYEKSNFRDSYYMDFGFTTNLKLSDGLIYCLNGISWIEHHECYDAIGQDMVKKHYVYVNTFYMNKLGEVILGKQVYLDFVTQRQKIPHTDAYSYKIKLLSPVQKSVYDYVSSGKKLHDEIFIERKYKFASGYTYDISDNDRCYNVLKNASIINRATDTNCIYVAVQEKKEEVENIFNIISVAAIPFEIPLKFVRYIQTALEFIAYAIDWDGMIGFSDNFFNTRGSVPLSPIYHKFFKKIDAIDSYGNSVEGYKQRQEGKTEVYEEDFLMEEIFVLLQEELTKNKS